MNGTLDRPAAKSARRQRSSAGTASDARILDQAALQRLVGYNLRRAEVAMRGRVAQELAALDVRAVEYSILSLVARNAEVTQKDLGEALSVKRPNMVSLVGGLETRGYVTRRVLERDRRNHLLSITVAGQTALAEMDARLDRLEDEVFGAWSPGERAQLATMLKRIYAA